MLGFEAFTQQQATDSLGSFYSFGYKIVWKAYFNMADVTKQVIYEKLEETNGIVILNTTNPNLIRAKIDNVIMAQSRLLLADNKAYISGMARITISSSGYSVEVSDMTMTAENRFTSTNPNDKNYAYSFESLYLKNRSGTFNNIKPERMKPMDDFFEKLFMVE